MKEVVVIDCICILMGCLKGGVFCNVCVEILLVYLMNVLLVRNLGVDFSEIEDIIWGCVQ